MISKLELTQIIREVIAEVSTTGGAATFNGGQGEQYATPKAFKKKSSKNKILNRLGFKQISRPKRPSHTKLFDFL